MGSIYLLSADKIKVVFKWLIYLIHFIKSKKHRKNRIAHAFPFTIEGIKKILEAKAKDSSK